MQPVILESCGLLQFDKHSINFGSACPESYFHLSMMLVLKLISDVFW
jgi:hypothetical protein